jgi:integrase
VRLIGLVGFEPTASSSRTRRSTKLSHSPFTYENRLKQRHANSAIYTVCSDCMRALQSSTGEFEKVGECLYRYSSNGVYYGRIRVEGKDIKRSLHTTDREIARRKLAEFRNQQRQTDRSAGKVTIAALCDEFLKAARALHHKAKTVERRELIVGRIKSDWPEGRFTQVAKVKPGQCDLWLAQYKFGIASRNLHVACLKELFNYAVRNRYIFASPAAHLKYSKREKPIRLTPTFEQFKAIIADVRAQQFNADAQESADFLEFLGLAGLGQAEASSLTPVDVDFDSERIITFRHKTATGFAVPLYPQVRLLLERLCDGKAHNEPVFKIGDAKKALAGACRRLGYPPCSQRSLRRMFITRAIEKGVDVKVISEWQGHRDGGKLILDTYSHVNRAHSQRMAQLMTEGEPSNVVAIKSAA